MRFKPGKDEGYPERESTDPLTQRIKIETPATRVTEVDNPTPKRVTLRVRYGKFGYFDQTTSMSGDDVDLFDRVATREYSVVSGIHEGELQVATDHAGDKGGASAARLDLEIDAVALEDALLLAEPDR